MYVREMKRMDYTIVNRMTGLMRLACILLLAVVTALVVSCGGSDDASDIPTPNPPSPPQPNVEKAINFSGSLSEDGSETHARTRAGETVPLQDYNHHTTFHAWSYKTKTTEPLKLEVVMKNYSVWYADNTAYTTTSNSNNWEYVGDAGTHGTVTLTNDQTIKYWDFKAPEYRFFGYSGPDDNTVTKTYEPSEAEPTSVKLTFTVEADKEAQATASSPTIDVSKLPLYSRLWTKSGADISLSVRPVTLQFIRPIARVRFIFTFVEGVTFERKDLHDMTFGPTYASSSDIGIAKDGTVTITYPLTGTAEESWASSANSYYHPAYFDIDYYEDPETAVVPLYTNSNYPGNSHHWNYVLPRLGVGDGGQGPYTLSVIVKDNEPTTCEVPAEFMTWAPGHDYTYLFKMAASGSVSLDAVQVAVRNWNGKDPIDYPVYNW